MFRHSSTYRIQFNSQFPFGALGKIVDYLSLLGTDAVYASPIFQSSPGSKHGYDVTDPSAIDSDLGGKTAFERVVEQLQKKKIRWIQDIVPNHMAFNRHNAWLWDVLENGKESVFAGIFDIDWDHPEFEGKLMVPFLGKNLEQVISEGELKIVFEGGNFYFKYFDEYYPVNSVGCFHILNPNGNGPSELNFINSENLPMDNRESWNMLPPWNWIKNEIKRLYNSSTNVKEWLDGLLWKLNTNTSDLKYLHELQHYRLCFWKMTEELINYRRFFTVNGLICLRMEEPRVFKNYHFFLQDLLRQKTIDGLRIDHIDGLQDPDSYLDQLRRLTGRDMYIIAEKILEPNEELPQRWEVQGTTGYDFLAYVNNLMTNQVRYPILSGFYRKITGIEQKVEDIIYEKKKFILLERMKGELDNLGRKFWTSELVPEKHLSSTSCERMKKAIAEFLIVFPTYRSYSRSMPFDEENRSMLNRLIRQAISRNPGVENELHILKDLFTGRYGSDRHANEKTLHFFNRCMQFTGPLMAKGVEDTTMYYFNEFIAHNEVGDHPGSSGISPAEFHQLMLRRQGRWPMSMNSTSTHDTKRGEDVRARLNVLSDLAPEWISSVESWMKMNAGYKCDIDGMAVPTCNEEYFIYQTLTGIWSMNQVDEDDFMDRLRNYFIKAMREAKTHSAWNEPEEEHEKAVIEFLFRILSPDSSFIKSFLPFLEKVIQYGYINSLVQLVLKMTCPGIPDLYQGTELWDLTLVDPDNRQPVDFEARYANLQKLVMQGEKDPLKLWMEMVKSAVSGDIKLWLTHLLLRERKRNPDLFIKGAYMPLEIIGEFRNHAIAYGRRMNEWKFIVVLPLYLADIQPGMKAGKNKINWDDTSVQLKEGMAGSYLDIISGEKFSIGSSLRPVDFFGSDPLILLRSV